MPLPAALAARLARRGILPKQKKAEVEEEVFAEDYDDHEDDGRTKSLSHYNDKNTHAKDDVSFMGYPGCPNKWNVYHECTVFCQRHWGSGKLESQIDSEYQAIRIKMLAKYANPLPEGWKEKYDPGTARHFYWCTRTDRVSWLPPGHPKAKPTEAASKVREQLSIEAAAKRDRELEAEDKMSLDSEDGSEDEAEEDRRLQEKRKREKEKRKEEEKKLKEKRKKKEEEALDPMDPAAYSDVPRGTWSTGLPDQTTAKSGVDGTASGPLFQQRPYPNPGAILRANAAAARAELDDED